MYQLVLGVCVIGAVIFLTFKYLMKGAPFIKVMSLGLIVAVTYLVISHLNKKLKEIKNDKF